MLFEPPACQSVIAQPLQGLIRDRRGVTSVEYVIIAIILAVAIMGGLSRIGGYLGTDFNNVSSEL